MKLTKEWKAVVTAGEESATFFFRTPTNEEINDFLAKRYGMSSHASGENVESAMFKRAAQARVDFFDALLTRVETLEGSDGTPITGPDRAAEIPVEWKPPIIVRKFESYTVDVKN